MYIQNGGIGKYHAKHYHLASPRTDQYISAKKVSQLYKLCRAMGICPKEHNIYYKEKRNDNWLVFNIKTFELAHISKVWTNL